MTQKYRDWVFAIGNVILCIAGIPALFNQIHAPVWTGALTTLVLASFAFNYFSIRYIFAAVTVGLEATLWLLITLEALTGVQL